METSRVEGRSGVWVLGDPVEQRPALGGLSLDFDPRLTDEEFDARFNGPEYAPSNAGQRREDRKIAAIGIRDAGVTSLSYELGREITIADVLPVAERHLRDVLENAELKPRLVEKPAEPEATPGAEPEAEPAPEKASA